MATCKFPDAKAVSASPLSILVVFSDGRERWVPLSQIDDESEVFAQGHEGTLITTEWWAIQAKVDDIDGESK